jgi:Flp pilus assembly protein TadG
MTAPRAPMLRRLGRDDRGSAAVEMALVTPIFLVLMFGAFDMGNYFLSEHVLVKAVRDGARYAARRGFSEFTCSTVSSDVISKTRNLVRTGTVADTGAARLRGWTDGTTTITVAASCNTTNAAYNNGIYGGMTAGVPVVTVTATLSYATLFKHFGITTTSLNMSATSQTAVMGA